MQVVTSKPVPGKDRRAADVAALYRDNRQQLVRLLVRRGSGPEQAEDIAQEAFIRLMAADEKGSIAEQKAYLFRTAINLSIDMARREIRYPTLAESNGALAAISDPASSPEVQVISRQKVDHLHSALAHIPTAALAALAGRMSGLTFAEIAQQQGVSLKSAFSRTARAVDGLQHMVEHGAASIHQTPRVSTPHQLSCPWIAENA